MKKLILLLLFFPLSLFAQQDSTRALIVIAHPDDESGMAATIYKITHELNGAVDLALITNGEGGYKYSLLAEPIYKVKLTDETIGRKHLPLIRKKELIAAGDILGIGNYFFFDQQDNHYTLDVDTVFREVWNTKLIKQRLHDIIANGNYDFIFCVLPTPETHGHHKGATILALQTVNELKEGKRPIVLGAGVSSIKDTSRTSFSGLDQFPITAVTMGDYSFTTDRTVTFGFKNQLSYKIIVNWEIAEHKSQGSMQTFMGRGDFENFWYFDVNGEAGKLKTSVLFDRLKVTNPSSHQK